MAASFLRHNFLDDPRRRFFCHSERKPVGWRYRPVHVEFNTDGCRRAIVARQPGQQLRLARVRRRIDSRDGETVRHSRECQPACADHRIYGTDSESNANSYSDSDNHSYSHSNIDTSSYSDANACCEAHYHAEAPAHASAASFMTGKIDSG